MKIDDLTKGDFRYCETCEMFFDFYAYDYSLIDAGHEDCKVREVTDEEFKECVKDCIEFDCEHRS